MDRSLQNSSADQFANSSLGSPVSLAEWIELVRGFLRRQYPIILFSLACVVALAFVYLYTTPKQYTAHAMLLIDSTKMHVLRQQESVMSELPLDTASVDTQVEVLKSEGVALSVVKEMKLTDD